MSSTLRMKYLCQVSSTEVTGHVMDSERVCTPTTSGHVVVTSLGAHDVMLFLFL